MNQVAVQFLTRSFAFSETIALLLRRGDGVRPQQRIVTVEQVLQSRYTAWLAHQNQTGANVYVSGNPLIPGSRKRTKEFIASVRHLCIDIDTDGEVRLAALRASDRIPAPNAILSTSPGKYQALWRVAGTSFEIQEQMLKSLAIAFGGDTACTDRNRVLRLPGFFNQKYSPAHLVTVEYPAERTYLANDFNLDQVPATPTLLIGARAGELTPAKHSLSEEDWVWILGELSRGEDAAQLTRTLALRRSDKPNPLYYAQRTVDMASARLCLAEGVCIDDIVTMLEVRRRFEIPGAVCSTRAQEIAETARRMVAHRKMA